MELERNVPILSNFINMISRELLEKSVTEELLFMEIDKGKQSVRDGRAHTRADFQRKYGLAK